jgi:uncharacterized protein (TIGR03067 family)
MLAKRLSRLGLPVSAGVLATVLSREALAAGLPRWLVSSTITVARIMATGQTVAGSLISAKAVALSGGVMKTMMLTKAGIGLMALVVIATTGIGSGAFFYHTQVAKAAHLDAEQKSYTKAAPQGVEDVAQNNGREGDDQPKQTAQDEISKELEKLQGAWVAISGHENGRAVPEAKIQVAALTLAIRGSQFVLKRAGTTDRLQGKLTIDPTKYPKTMDWSFEGTKTINNSKGIYELEGNALKFCHGEERPVDFKPKAKRDERLYVFHRQSRSSSKKRDEATNVAEELARQQQAIVREALRLRQTKKADLDITGSSDAIAVDLAKRIITGNELLGSSDEAVRVVGDRWKLSAGPATQIIIDGKKAQLEDLKKVVEGVRPGHFIRVSGEWGFEVVKPRYSVQTGNAICIDVKGPQEDGLVEAVPGK